LFIKFCIKVEDLKSKHLHKIAYLIDIKLCFYPTFHNINIFRTSLSEYTNCIHNKFLRTFYNFEMQKNINNHRLPVVLFVLTLSCFNYCIFLTQQKFNKYMLYFTLKIKRNTLSKYSHNFTIMFIPCSCTLNSCNRSNNIKCHLNH